MEKQKPQTDRQRAPGRASHLAGDERIFKLEYRMANYFLFDVFHWSTNSQHAFSVQTVLCLFCCTDFACALFAWFICLFDYFIVCLTDFFQKNTV